MRKLLNTLFILTENAFLSLEGETVYVEVNKKKIGQFPLYTLESIICFTYNGATPAFMEECAKREINLVFFNPFGKFLCRVVGESHGNVLLRKRQYRVSDHKRDSCQIARNFILGKVFNSRWSIDRTLRDHGLRVNQERCQKAVKYLTNEIEKIKQEEDLDSLRGLEGECASVYFGIFDELILNQKQSFPFTGRNKRPPLDRVNAMLSFGYTLLANDCASALEGAGLDFYVVFLHRDRPGRKSLRVVQWSLQMMVRKSLLLYGGSAKKNKSPTPICRKKYAGVWYHTFRHCFLPSICEEILMDIHSFCGNEG